MAEGIADGPIPNWSPPVLDYQGQPNDGRTFIAKELVLENENKRLLEEIDFLRDMLRAALESPS